MSAAPRPLEATLRLMTWLDGLTIGPTSEQGQLCLVGQRNGQVVYTTTLGTTSREPLTWDGED